MVKCYQKDYPRPQFVREEWFSLDGKWRFCFDDENIGEQKEYYKKFPENAAAIVVPYAYETPASGIKDGDIHGIMWYQRTFKTGRIGKEKKLLLNFEGVDYRAKVWLNGVFVGGHEGGYCRFTIDGSNAIRENAENILTVRCEDSMATDQPRGKQRWLKQDFGCWYKPTSGIWKPVWGEIVSASRLKSVKMTPDIDASSVRIDYETENALSCELETVISFGGKTIVRTVTEICTECFTQVFDLRCGEFDFKIKLWNTDCPNLYDVEFILRGRGKVLDRVGSYFGMRKIETDEKGIRFNNAQFYQKLVLAQNYWPETGLTMPDEEAGRKDILLAKQAGFNGLRIHQKIEDERFLFLSDTEGLLVWAEYPATYEFNDRAISAIAAEWLEAVRQQYNHPCVIAWVPFNESWGIPNVYTDKLQQRFTEGIYYLTKAFDAMRPVMCNDGWEHTCSDIVTVHDYDGCVERVNDRYKNDMKDILDNKIAPTNYRFVMAKGYEYQGQPIVVSEYGGFKLAGTEGWGYDGEAKDAEDLVRKYDKITSAYKKMEKVCGFCYTQLTDVYHETNGLMSFDRVPKVPLEEIKKINER